MVKQLVNAGATLDTTNKMGRIPLYETIVFEQRSIFDYLLSLGANALHKGKRGCTGPHCLACAGNSGAMQSVLRSCRLDEVNAVDSNSWSPLH